MPNAPILQNKRYAEESHFQAANLLREARRQKGLRALPPPSVCVLDPDGDILRHLRKRREATLNRDWACYHTELYDCTVDGLHFGLIGCAVGASFAVLLAEELFASGCELLISVTSSGQILPVHEPPFFVLITQALRDEGTSYHYLPPADYAALAPALSDALTCAFDELPLRIHRGATWTTDAPFRETATAIQAARDKQILAVEMEAAALYAFATARKRPVVCFAHVTNQMGAVDGDFEKGEADGSVDALQLIVATARALT